MGRQDGLLVDHPRELLGRVQIITGDLDACLSLHPLFGAISSSTVQSRAVCIKRVRMLYCLVQDTLNALEALAEYELKRPANPEANLIAEFTVPGKLAVVRMALERKKDKVETNLKVSRSVICFLSKYTQEHVPLFWNFCLLCQRFIGNEIQAHLTGKGDVKLKVSLIDILYAERTP